MRLRPTVIGCRGEHSVEAQRRAAVVERLLSGLAHGDDVIELGKGGPPSQDDTFPGEVFISLAVEALNAAGIERDTPLPYDRLRQRQRRGEPVPTFVGRLRRLARRSRSPAAPMQTASRCRTRIPVMPCARHCHCPLRVSPIMHLAREHPRTGNPLLPSMVSRVVKR